MRLYNQVLLARLLTRSGDQAWDFAVPITLVVLYPTQFSLIASIFLATKLGQFTFQPVIAGIIDRWKRNHTAYLGTILQLVSVMITAVLIRSLLPGNDSGSASILTAHLLLKLIGIVICTVFSSLGAGLMDIAVGNDWIPTLVSTNDLPKVNSKLKQIDLLTEVLSPILGGLLLTLSSPADPLFGFLLVVAWNVFSFIPEILLLRSVFNRSNSLKDLPKKPSEKTSLFMKTFQGWQEFWKHPSALAMVAYAFLWLSALSPHGVLLTSFLRGGWQISESTLGVFRGLGAAFGLTATFIYPKLVTRLGVRRSGLVFIFFQALILFVAWPFFANQTLGGFVFLALILISRIGLYGFSLCEMEIRQRTIDLGHRGQINGVASALTSFATLILFGMGSFVSSPNDFGYLVKVSIFFVCCGAATYLYWWKKSISLKIQT